MNWSEFSFVLKPSPISGVGVFATHDISAGTLLCDQQHVIRLLNVQDLPQELLSYCVYINEKECMGPERFDRMEIGWYINHSSTPNVEHHNNVQDIVKKVKKDGTCTVNSSFFALKDIKAGDEIVIDYNYLAEPELLKEDYYANS